MATASVLERLRDLEPELQAEGIRSLYLFGSEARGTAGPQSDVDLFCDLDKTSELGFRFFALADRIADLLGRPVDLTTRNGLHPLIRQDVIREAVRVF